MFKRGQQPAATSAGILIIIIAVILVMYILFLPPEERADLLGEENETSGVGLTESGYNKTLLEENIGRLDYLSFDYREHDIPSFRIYSEKQGTVLKSLSSIYVTHNIGNKKSYNVSFQVDKKYSSNTFLSFNVKESRGRLEIYLNGREIFNGVLDDGSPLPIELPKDVLESKNNLMFKASNPGIVFWKNNEYLLENVLITADVLDVSNSVSRQFFYLSDVEKLNLDDVKLKYYPNCDSKTVGPLLISLNGDEVFSGISDCGVYNTLYLDKNAVFKDKNELEFVATEGSYLIDRVSVRTELKELVYPVYYFELDEELFYDDDLKDDFNVSMSLRFVNNEEKRLEYNINGIRRQVSTDNFKYVVKLDDYVVSGTNSLELVPKTVIDIAELKVTITNNRCGE